MKSDFQGATVSERSALRCRRALFSWARVRPWSMWP